ncbi:S-methyl-5'-thioinosine phosphorylase [Acidihalobacter ferrooxydans]|uniref:Probable S-methyl-5'-thioinosine phosphorylase n=1 Tax=Acidihalobacter ferrooxydans TaxID=1765967 RepID=A0A1P8UHZ9_9GAMM|nr:S-methyl-5'-thioinosine phosphorylase [Acidihalobacter ferrooxydans]APZ43424.1 5'-methylthioadenosine phosphorylase [Acidihalobacter ferrooxydans]
MSDLAIIGGTGLTRLSGLEITRREVVHTPYGEPSGPVTHGRLLGHAVAFIPRHGSTHNIPPHRVNYRANLWALRHIGLTHVVAVAAVGGVTPAMEPCRVAIPDQVIDYTWARAHTFFEEDLEHVTHIDFTEPYCAELRARLIQAGASAGLDVIDKATYGATQGPRLESAAEIDRLERDGCDVVGMTGMPEAALARELGLCYASCAVVANWAPGRGDGTVITMDEISANLVSGMEKVKRLLEALVTSR